MKNRIEIKKMEEMQLLRYFIHCYPEFPKGKIQKSESPDFIIRTSRHHSIGLELTKIYLQKGRDGLHFVPRFEEEKTELLDKIKDRFEQELAFKISAHFDFSDHYYDMHSDLDLLAKEIYDIMSLKLKNWSVNEAFHTTIKSKKLPDWLDAIDIIHHPENLLSDWIYCKVNVPPENFLQSIQQIIQQKDDKLRRYMKNRLDQYTLLIIAECLNCASPFNINNLIERWSFQSHFHQIFLFEMFEQKVHELRVE